MRLLSVCLERLSWRCLQLIWMIAAVSAVHVIDLLLLSVLLLAVVSWLTSPPTELTDS